MTSCNNGSTFSAHGALGEDVTYEGVIADNSVSFIVSTEGDLYGFSLRTDAGDLSVEDLDDDLLSELIIEIKKLMNAAAEEQDRFEKLLNYLAAERNRREREKQLAAKTESKKREARLFDLAEELNQKKEAKAVKNCYCSK